MVMKWLFKPVTLSNLGFTPRQTGHFVLSDCPHHVWEPLDTFSEEGKRRG